MKFDAASSVVGNVPYEIGSPFLVNECKYVFHGYADSGTISLTEEGKMNDASFHYAYSSYFYKYEGTVDFKYSNIGTTTLPSEVVFED